MDNLKKRVPDYTDIAYREAVSRLRYLLAESYSPQPTPTKIRHIHPLKVEDSGDETDGSAVISDRSRHVSYRTPFATSKHNIYTDSLPKSCATLHIPPKPSSVVRGPPSVVAGDEGIAKGSQLPPELMTYIERQEEYIDQLEKESQYCREELSNLIGRVKDVISENEGLHEKEKSGLLKSVFDCFESGEEDDEGQVMDTSKDEERKKQRNKKKRLEGPSIIFESRISELEAQLTQTKIDLRKALEETETYKKKLSDGHHPFIEGSTTLNIETYQREIEMLQREKEELKDSISKLNAAVSQIREKEADASHKVKRSLDVVDQAQFERTQAELEVRRLKEELDRQHEKLRDLLQEQGRKIQEERVQAERRYAQQIEQLSCDLTTQWDVTSKLQLELERQRRVEADLRRELQQKNSVIEELKKELNTKIAGLQSEASQSAAERGSLEQELSASRLMVERAEREARQEASRLQAEVAALRQRLDRADADLMHSRRENLRLSEQVSSLEREVNLAKLMKDGTEKPDGSPSKLSGGREKELTSMIMDMEAKHVKTVAELEGMIQSQNQVMEKLKDECHSLTKKLEDSSARHKEGKAALREENLVLLGKLERVWKTYKELHEHCSQLNASYYEVNPERDEQVTPMLRSANQDQMENSILANSSMSHRTSTIFSNSTSHSKRSLDMSNSRDNLFMSRPSNKCMNPNRTRSPPAHLPLSPRRREVDPPPLTLEDLASDSDSCDS